MTKMTVEVNKDAYGFPSIVSITKEGKTLQVTTNPDMGFTIEGPRGLLPDVMEAFRVILPRVSYHQEVGVTQGEENTEVTNNTTAYVLVKTVGLILSESHIFHSMVLSLKAEVGTETSYIKVTVQPEGKAETTFYEGSTSSVAYIIKTVTTAQKLNTNTVFRVYLKNSVAGHKAFSKQMMLVGDNVNLVGHLF